MNVPTETDERETMKETEKDSHRQTDMQSQTLCVHERVPVCV